MSHFTKMDLMLDRREATTKAVAGLTIGAPLIECVERWLAPAHERPQWQPLGAIGLDEVEQIEQAERLFREGWQRFGGGLRRKAVVGQLNEIADLLRDSHPAEVTRRLFRVMAYLADTAAMMCWDSGRQAVAQRYHILALRATKEAGDYGFGAKILISMARQSCYNHGNQGARPTDALELIRLAGDGAKGQATPTLWAALHSYEAHAYAKLGRVQAFRRATGKAEDAMANADPSQDPHWIQYFNEAEFAGATGSNLLALAEARPECGAAGEAVGSKQRAVRLHPAESMRNLGLDQAGLAQAYFLQGELEAAVSAGHRAIEIAGQTRSDRVRVSLADVYRLTVAYKREQAVREFSDLLGPGAG